MKDFENSLRIAALHNQDLELQLRTQQQDAHEAMQRQHADWDEAHGRITWNPHPNDAEAVTQTLKAQTAANGSAEIPAGTFLVHDGSTINSPGNDADTQAGLLEKYKQLAGVIPGIPAFPRMDKAQFVPSKNLDLMTHALQGYSVNGSPMTHDQLNQLIPALKAQRDAMAKSGNSTPYRLNTLDNLIGIYQANEKNHSAAEDAAFKKAQAQQLDTLNKSEAIRAKYAMEKQDNAAGDKQQKASVGSIVGFDPQTNERVVVNASDPKSSTLSQSSKVSGTQLDNWGTAQNQFANVQLAVSRYHQAARNFAQSGKPSDIVGINSALNKTGIGDVQIGEWGVRVPGFSSIAEAGSRVANSTAFKNLSPAGQDLIDKYFRMMSSIPEYQKASTGIGRTNKEMLDLELKNIPDPTMPPSIISNRLGSFQEALSSNASRVPHIQGVPHHKDVTQHYQQSSQPQSSGSDLGRSVMGNPTDLFNRLQPTR